jgi:hypothetical protein
MSVYDFNCRRSDSARLYTNGRLRKAAVDLPPDNQEKCCEKEDIPKKEDTRPQNQKKSEIFDKLFGEFFDSGIDSDKLLIAALLYMLIKEGADIKLILALGYILM